MTDKQAAQSKGSGLRRNLVETEILERAAQLFAERGYAATSLQDISTDLGVSRSSLYHYFENKEEMLLRLVSNLVVSSDAALKRIQSADSTDPPAHLRMAVEALLGPIVEAPNRFRLLLTVEAELPEDIARRWERTRRSIVTQVTEIIREGVRRERFRPVDEQAATFTVLGMCNWVAWWPSHQREDLHALHHGISDIAVAGLLAADHEPAAETPAAAIEAARRHLDRLERLVGADGPG